MQISQWIGPNMRNCGRHIVLLAMMTLTLAACGGGEESAADAPGGNNLPPIIAGTPVTTLSAGSFYSFTPDRRRSGRRSADFQRHQRSGLGHFQYSHRRPDRHADRSQRRHDRA